MGLFGIKISLKNPFGPRSLFRTVAKIAPNIPIPPISTVVGLASKAAAIAGRAAGLLGRAPGGQRPGGTMPGGAPAPGPLPPMRAVRARAVMRRTHRAVKPRKKKRGRR